MLIRVLEIPKSSGGDCFMGGNPQTWVEVDWFRDDSFPLTPDTIGEYESHVKQRRYYDPSKASAAVLKSRKVPNK